MTSKSFTSLEVYFYNAMWNASYVHVL